jgi:hypothetical protein
MPEAQNPEERPCLHCTMVELIEDFFAENPAMSGEPDTIDTDEVIAVSTSTSRPGASPLAMIPALLIKTSSRP